MVSRVEDGRLVMGGSLKCKKGEFVVNDYTVAIIGGGPGGYETAIRLNQLGISVICFEKERLGGVCLNKGCIPTKALVKVAELYTEMKHADEFGLQNFDFEINYQKIFNRKSEVVEKLVSGIEFLFHKRGIKLEKQTIQKIEKKEQRYHLYSSGELCCISDYVIIATGSEPKELSFLKFDNQNILSSDHVLSMCQLPKSITIIGGGVIGCEFASIFAQFGVNVNIVEYQSEIIPTEDEEISKRLALALKKMGIKIFTNTSVEKTNKTENEIELILSNGKKITSEKVLVSVGRKPVFDIQTIGFDLHDDKGFIGVNDFCMTNVENIFAIGDINGKLMLAHTAAKQGLLVAEYIFHKTKDQGDEHKMKLLPLKYENIPSCIFTNPEVASCGLTEKKAKESYKEIKTGKFPYVANGKALGIGAIFGFVKTIINSENDEIVGMHIIGHLATELVAQASILISTKAKVSDVANIVFAHPTISECIMESVEDTHKMAIHLV